MTSSLDEFVRVTSPVATVPKGWEPVVEDDGEKGTATNIPAPEAADDRRLLEEAGLDPDSYFISGGRKHRRWQMGGEWQHYWAFNFSPRSDEDDASRVADIEELKRLFKKRPAARKSFSGDGTFSFVGADWQIGKGEGGGTAATVDRVRESIQDAKAVVKELRRTGRSMASGAFLGMGDLHEGCTGFYPMQEWQTDLNRRDQNKVVRRLIREAISELAPMFDDFLVTGVGGNHGEHRKDGKAFTDFADNDDVSAMEVVQEAIIDRPGFDHVRFMIPSDELALCVDLSGVHVGLAHGHQFGGGATAQKKAENWWAHQAFGFQPLAKAQILLSGHYHHFSATTYGQRTHIQAPSLDGGSLWFRNQTGNGAPPGALIFRTDPSHPLGFDDLRII